MDDVGMPGIPCRLSDSNGVKAVRSFSETLHAKHVSARAKLMAGRFNLPPSFIHRGQELSSSTDSIVTGLMKHGIALFRGGASLSDEAFMAIGERFGTLMPEHAANAGKFTSREVILNVVSCNGHDAPVSDQPFSTHHLRLHSECSRRAEDQQPRYLAFLCSSPGSAETRAQTLIVSMARVAARLTDKERLILSRICYANSLGSPPLLREDRNGPVFSFRDFGPDVMEWQAISEDDPVTEEAGNAAIQALLVAMYDNAATFGVTWRVNDLLILDNMRVFHGRSDASPQPIGNLRRIKRLRILADVPG